jgi:hypothetical protein
MQVENAFRTIRSNRARSPRSKMQTPCLDIRRLPAEVGEVQLRVRLAVHR